MERDAQEICNVTIVYAIVLPLVRFFFRFYLFIFRERGRREKEREKNIIV